MSFTIWLTGILLLFVVSKILTNAEKIRKQIQKSKIELKLLKPGRFSAKEVFDIEYNTSATEHIAENLKKQGRIAHLTLTEAIIYTPITKLPKYKYMINSHIEKMPLRIIIKIIDRKLSVQLDEDYGWQMINGPALRIFKKKYQKAFLYYFNLIEEILNK